MEKANGKKIKSEPRFGALVSIERMLSMGFFRNLFTGSTDEIPVVCNVDLERYAGTWYEIARLPHSFEKDLDNVTALYKIRRNGKIKVINTGYKFCKKKVARALAWVPDPNCTGRLMVSFFRPFKSEYKIIKLDEQKYSYSVVSGSNKNYLWILSRKPKMNDRIYKELIEYLDSKGFNVSKIIKVPQNRD